MRAELVHLRESTEKLRTVTWANEPVATLEDAVVEVATVRSMLDSIECGALAAYDASKEYKATGDTSAAARIAWLTQSRKSAVERRCRLGRQLRSMPHTVAAFELGAIGLDHVEVLSKARVPSLAVRFAQDEELLVGYARTLPFDEFSQKVSHWRDVSAPEDAEERALSQFEAREAHSSATFEGMGRVDAWLDRMGFHEFDTELRRHEQLLWEQDWADARARLGDRATKHGLGRTAAQRRADALVEPPTQSRPDRLPGVRARELLRPLSALRGGPRPRLDRRRPHRQLQRQAHVQGPQPLEGARHRPTPPTTTDALTGAGGEDETSG